MKLDDQLKVSLYDSAPSNVHEALTIHVIKDNQCMSVLLY